MAAAPRVIVTRPAREAAQWVQQLGAHGIPAVALPLIAIAPCAGAAARQALAAARARLRQCPAHYGALMFVSGNAVSHFLDCKPNTPDVPVNTAFVAIKTRAWAAGPGTAAALLRAGVPAEQIDAPAPGAAQFDSEALWQQVAQQVRPGTRVLIVRGCSRGARGGGIDGGYGSDGIDSSNGGSGDTGAIGGNQIGGDHGAGSGIGSGINRSDNFDTHGAEGMDTASGMDSIATHRMDNTANTKAKTSPQGTGRDWLARQILAAGGAVDFVAAYERSAAPLSAAQRALARCAVRCGALWLLSSAEAAGHLAALLPARHRAAARALATHPRIAAAASAAGFGRVQTCRPGLADVLASIESGA